MTRLEAFLSGVPILASLTPQQVAALAARTSEREYRAGELILRAGERNRSLYLLQSGQLAVQVSRGPETETVAHLHPGAPFGELSLLTGRSCSADVRAIADATVAVLSDSALNELPEERRVILEMLSTTMAERLHASVSGRSDPRGEVVLLLQYPGWRAPSAFAAELARSLARQAEWLVLRVEVTDGVSREPALESPDVWVARQSVAGASGALLDALSAQIETWRSRFACIVLNVPPDVAGCGQELARHADWCGHLLGPSDRLGRARSPHDLVMQDATGPTLPRLSGREQLISEVAAAQQAHASRRPIGPRFRRSVDSFARSVACLQVGLALGGGGAWAWSHIGVMRVLARAGIGVDAISGCSMGSQIGALLATGRDPDALEQFARGWHRRFWRLLEYRFWRMHLGRVGAITGLLREQLGDRLVNETEIPFWANALDVETAEEIALTDGDLVSALLASNALPAWLPPQSRGGRLLIDAVLVNPVPASLTRRMHCDFNIAVHVIGPSRARALPPRWPFRAYDFVSRCLRIVGHQMGQARLEASADVVLVPDLPADTSMLSFDRYEDIIAAGEREAEARLPSILAAYGNLRRTSGSRRASMATTST